MLEHPYRNKRLKYLTLPCYIGNNAISAENQQERNQKVSIFFINYHHNNNFNFDYWIDSFTNI